MSAWTVVDEQPVEDYLLGHERAEMAREGPITEFTARSQLDLRLADERHLREARNRRLGRRARAPKPYRRRNS